MKKNTLILSLVLVLILCATACTGRAGLSDPASSGSQMPVSHTEGGISQDNPAGTMSAQMPASSRTVAGTLAYKGFTTGNIPDAIKNVYYGGGPNVLVTTADTLYLYDLSRDAVAAQTETTPSARTYRAEYYKPIQNGFVGLLLDLNRQGNGSGFQSGGSAPNVSCVFYDLELNKIQEINVLEALSDAMSEDDRRFGIHELSVIDVSDDGSKIVVGSMSSLYVYDIETKTGSQIIPASENMIPGAVRFASNSRIAFGGAYLPAGAPESIYSYGTVNTDGSDLKIHMPQGFRAGELPGVTDSFVLIGQDIRAASGQLLLHPTDGEARTIKLATSREGDMAYLSEDGTYFATAVNGEKLAIRIYEMETGSLLAETFIAEEDITLISRVPDVCILDSLRTAVVIYGQHVDTQIEVIQF